MKMATLQHDCSHFHNQPDDSQSKFAWMPLSEDLRTAERAPLCVCTRQMKKDATKLSFKKRSLLAIIPSIQPIAPGADKPSINKHEHVYKYGEPFIDELGIYGASVYMPS